MLLILDIRPLSRIYVKSFKIECGLVCLSARVVCQGRSEGCLLPCPNKKKLMGSTGSAL